MSFEKKTRSRRCQTRRARAADKRRNYLKLGLALLLASAFSSYCMAPDSQVPAAQYGGTDHAGAYHSLRGPDAPAKRAQGAKRLRPANHDVAWMERHAGVARANSSDCASCHQEQDCVACHTADLGEAFQVHPPNFAIVHSIDAKINAQDCTSCHQPQSFCAECHMRSGVSAIDGFRPPVRAEFHPPGWSDPAQPNNHGVMARRDINDCASCHQERDCVTCHVNINPHPPEFQLNCRGWINADPRPCAQCHGDLAALKQLCL